MPSVSDRPDEADYPAGWLTNFRRGVVAGVVVPGLALATVGLGCLLAWLTAGSAAGSVGSALRTAGLAVLAGLRGGVILAGSPTTLPPLTVSILLVLLLRGPVCRLSSASGFVGMVTGFVLGCMGISRWARLGSSHTSVWGVAIAAAVFVLGVGGALRRAAAWWPRISQRTRRVLSAAAAIAALYLAAGSLAVAVQLGRNLGTAIDLQHQLAPGVGGLPVALLGLALAPNAALAGAGYLAGPGFTLGAHTHVSVLGASNGPLPVFPLLAAVPKPSTGIGIVGLCLLTVVAVAAGLLTVAMMSDTGGWSRLPDALMATVAAGGALALLGTLSRGDIGTGSLRGVGVLGWQTGVAVTALTATASMLVLLGDLMVKLLRPGLPVAPAVPLRVITSDDSGQPAAVAAAPTTSLRGTG